MRLAGMGIVLVHDEGELATRLQDWRSCSFGCTLGSTMARLRSDGFMAPVRVDLASFRSASISGLKSQQRVIRVVSPNEHVGYAQEAEARRGGCEASRRAPLRSV
jgi:hypothetical protein